jgi:hypothetical protein
MATDARFDVDSTQWNEPQKKSWWQTCLTGCLIVFVVLLAVAILGGIWVTHHWRGWASNFGSAAIKQAVEASDLVPQQKQAIGDQVDRVADAFRTGRLSVDQMGSIMEKIAKSPLMTLIMVTAADKKYVAHSGLSAAEKAEGRETVQRFASGAMTHKVDRAGIDAAMAHISDMQPNGQVRLRQTVSDDELRAFLSEAKQQADKAGIAAQPESVDVAAEFQKIVDEAMNENPQQPTPEVPK